jgi:ATP-binding cassette, subfamily B, multidrug efflux pump
MLESLRPLFPYLSRYRRRFLLGFGALILTQALSASLPLILRKGIDSLSAGVAGRTLLFFAGLLVILALTKAFFQFWMRWILIGISRDVEYDLRNDLFAHLLRLSPRYYTQNRTGDLMSKLTNDLNAVRNLVGPGIMYSAYTLASGVLTISVMLYLDWQLTALALVPLPLVSVAVSYLGRKIHDRFEAIQALYSDLTERVRESLAGVRVIRAFCQEKPEEAAFDRMNRRFVSMNRRLIWISSALWPAVALLFSLALLLVLVVGGKHVLSGQISVGTFAAFNVYLVQLIWPIVAMGFVVDRKSVV